MSDSSATIGTCLDWVDQAASDLVLLNPRDLPSMAKYAKECEKQAKDWQETIPEIPVPVLELIRAVADRIKNIILDRVPSVEEAMAAVGRDLESARSLLAGLIEPQKRDPNEVKDSAESSAPSSSPQADSSVSADSGGMVVDDEIIAAYVEQQQMVLPEMEQDILAYEKDRDNKHLADLRRKIHTLKGESGAVDALDLEKVCHRLEDYLDHPPANLAVDVLFDSLDWIAHAVVSFSKGQKPSSSDELLAKFVAPIPDDAPVSLDKEPDLAFDEGVAVAVMPDYVEIGDPELSRDFVAEAQEHFEIADENLMILEKAPDDKDAVGAVFRSFHTIKGVAGFLGLTPIGDLAHAAETLLDEVRQGERLFHGLAVELTFAALDMLKQMMRDLEMALQKGTGLAARKELPLLLEKLHELLEKQDDAAKLAKVTRQAALETAEPEEEAEEAVVTSAVHAGPQTMKVDAIRIDQLLDTIGELVIIESIVSGDPEIRALNSIAIEKNLALLSKITHSLRDMGMSMRLVPVDPVFKKMARLVRDLSRKSGKKVELTLKGGDTEIDKGMVEKLGDPLVHMIRNSMDHGLESAADRVASGKTPEGHIVLHAHHVGGSIHIDIQDDGRGLNRDAIVERALERGLIQSADGMSDQDIYSLIFEAGFSTAKQVTEISGRGVGMDVVRRNIESLRGNVLIRSTPGQGSTFTLVLPLTTAIIDGMLMRVGRETYIMPTLSIIESFRPTASQVHLVTGKGEMVSYREDLLALFRLSNLLQVPDAVKEAAEGIVVVVEEYGKQWGLLVDDLLGQQQIVIKSMGDGLGRTAGVVGASILADGRPGLILDVADVIRIARDSQSGYGGK